jgi:hypothetical protein
LNQQARKTKHPKWQEKRQPMLQIPRSCSKTRFELLSGHGFNRAEAVSSRPRLQPLRANDALQGLKPTLFPISIGTTKVVP